MKTIAKLNITLPFAVVFISLFLLAGGIMFNAQTANATCHVVPYAYDPDCAFISGPAVAPSDYCPPNEICSPIGSKTFEELMVRVAYYLFILSIPIVSIMILWGAFLMLTAAGDPGKIQKGKDTIKWAIWGFVAVILAGGVATIIRELIGVAAPTL